MNGQIALIPVSRLNRQGIEYVSPDALEAAARDFWLRRSYIRATKTGNGFQIRLRDDGTSTGGGRARAAPYNREFRRHGVTWQEFTAYFDKWYAAKEERWAVESDAEIRRLALQAEIDRGGG